MPRSITINQLCDAINNIAETLHPQLFDQGRRRNDTDLPVTVREDSASPLNPRRVQSAPPDSRYNRKGIAHLHANAGYAGIISYWVEWHAINDEPGSVVIVPIRDRKRAWSVHLHYDLTDADGHPVETGGGKPVAPILTKALREKTRLCDRSRLKRAVRAYIEAGQIL